MNFQTVISSVSTQVCVMLTLIILGYVLSKRNILSARGIRELSDILLNVVTPCVMIRAYHIPFERSKIQNLILAYVVCFAVHFIYIILSKVIFSPTKDREKRMINSVSSTYSNCGFMAIPLIESCLGKQGVFYGSAYLGVFNIIVWTVCKGSFEKGSSHREKANLINPGILGVLIGLIFYFTQLKLPAFLYNSVSFMADLNTPVAMLILGNLLARSGIIKSLKDPGVYVVSLFKLFAAPLLLALILGLIKTDTVMALSIVISAACPVATIIPIFAQKYNINYEYATNLTVATTLLSLITIPFICLISSYIL